MVSAAIPPTGSNRVPAGTTAPSALSTAGLAASAGKSFSAAAPAASAAKASLGVAKPGNDTRPDPAAAATTSTLVLGEMSMVPQIGRASCRERECQYV